MTSMITLNVTIKLGCLIKQLLGQLLNKLRQTSVWGKFWVNMGVDLREQKESRAINPALRTHIIL